MSKREKVRLKDGKRSREAAGPAGRSGGGPETGYALSRAKPMHVRDYPTDPAGAIGLGYLPEAGKELPFQPVEALAHKLDMSANQLAKKLLGISRSTVGRRREKGKQTLDESAKIQRFSELLQFAVIATDGDEDAARRWMSKPLVVLNGESALEHARTETGAREVEQVIGRFVYGVYG